MNRFVSQLLLPLTLCVLVIAPLWADKPPSVKTVGSESVPPEKLIVGEAEYVAIPALNSVFAARIDTGAKTTSIYAVDIEIFERDGKPWARFTVINPGQDKEFPLEMEIARSLLIKQQGDDAQRRHSVALDLTMGKITKRIDVNLADRSNYKFPLLIGRDFLQGSAIVDVAQKYTQKTPGAPKSSKKRSK